MSTTTSTNPDLQTAIDKVLVELDTKTPGTDEYAKLVEQLDKLIKIKVTEKPVDKLSKDTLTTVLGSIAGIVAIIGFERANIITSKALGFVLKR